MLNDNQNSICILQIDGGGVKGIIPAVICAEIERLVGKPIYEIFDLITGTSTGAVIGGTLAAGVSAQELKQFYLTHVVDQFRHGRSLLLPWNWFRPKYERSKFQTMIQTAIGDCSICDTKTNFMATTFNLCSQRTHFIKSWEEKDRKWKLIDVISWSSLSAVYYFDKINVPTYEWVYESPEGTQENMMGAVFQDGGQGQNNSTLTFDLFECLANDYRNVFILSIGTGQYDDRIKYSVASKSGLFNQAINFLFQARNESIPNQVAWAKYVDKKRTDFDICRLDATISKAEDRLDAYKFAEKYESIGNALAKKIPIDKLT